MATELTVDQYGCSVASQIAPTASLVIAPAAIWLSQQDDGAMVPWEQLQVKAGWPVAENDVMRELQMSRRTHLVTGLRRQGRLLPEGERFGVDIVRGKGVRVLRGDDVLKHRHNFEIEKVKRATTTAVKRLKTEMEAHQVMMTELGRHQMRMVVNNFRKMMERAGEDLDDMLKDLEVVKAHWKNDD